MRRGIVLAMWVALGAAACGGESKVSPIVEEAPTLVVAPNAVTLAVGGADTLTYLLAGAEPSADMAVDWSATDTTVVRLSTALAPRVIVVSRKAGSATVVATWRADPSIVGGAAVTVR